MKYYFTLAIKDVLRLWPATQLQVIIIAGICLPILMLLGLKNGHVAELRKKLITQPTSRRIKFQAGMESDLITNGMISTMQQDLPQVDTILPVIWKQVRLQKHAGANDKKKDNKHVLSTIYATLPGDPILEAHSNIHIDSLAENEIILAETLANRLGAAEGDTLGVTVERELEANRREKYTMQLALKHVVPDSGSDDGMVGHAHLSLINKLEKYMRGRAVPEWNLPVSPMLRTKPKFYSYLLFCLPEDGDDLSATDHKKLQRQGLRAEPIEDDEKASLYGMLNEKAQQELKIYELSITENKDAAPGSQLPAMDDPTTLQEMTSSLNDFVVFTAAPKILNVNEMPVRLVGINLPSGNQIGSWIQDYLKPDANWYTFQDANDKLMSTKMTQDLAALIGPKSHITTEGENARRIPLMNLSYRPADPATLPPDGAYKKPNGKNRAQQPGNAPATDSTDDKKEGISSPGTLETPADEQKMATIIVPVALLTNLEQLKQGAIQYEPLGNRFVPHPLPIDYTSAYLFTHTIDEVPATSDILQKRGFGVSSKNFEIKQIHKQTNSLSVLVRIVAIGVFLFGVITVFSVLVDSTDRKKGTIGIYRVMGVSRIGVFYILLVRALSIGLMAAFLCSGLGFIFATLLSTHLSNSELFSWLPTINIILTTNDYLTIAAGALLCASVGVLIPAIKASRVDPFEAIMQGQFN